MGKRKIFRTPEEEEEIKKIKREQNRKVKESTRRKNKSLLESQNIDNHNIAFANFPSTSHDINTDCIQNAEVLSQSTFNENLECVQPKDELLQKIIVDNPTVINNTHMTEHNYCKKMINERTIKKNTECTKFNLKNIEESYIGPMNVLCIHCEAKHFVCEKVSKKGNSFNDCCGHGEYSLEKLPELPQDLKSLFNREHPKSNNFFSNIRSYNSCISFASFNTNLIQFQGRPGPYCFKIQGQIYYQINTTLLPKETESPTYGQLFIIDQNEATKHRVDNNSNLDQDILNLLDTVMRENNIFAQSYEMMGKELEEQRKKNDTSTDLQLLFGLKSGIDRHRYNSQRVNEVAVVFDMNADGEIPDSYVVIRNKNTKELKTVSTMDPNVEPWIYPLFHPFGTRGWHKDLFRKSSQKRITRANYFKYRLALREHEYNVFIHGGRLFQQWLVDSFVKIEKDRTNFCRQEQAKLRIETYKGLTDYLDNTANNSNARVGKMFILPSTFPNSPRNMMQSYQDSMAVAREFGKPDLFITMTCNPNWVEIRENLNPGDDIANRPDLIARVFHAKQKQLIELIVEKKIFGSVLAYVFVIEFQKRGLPHMHLLVTLTEQCKLNNTDLIDQHISAEIPDPNEHPKLHEIVMKHMIHGPCNDRCLIEGKCSKHFPKPFQEETVLDQNSYPTYRRRDFGKTYDRPGRYVVDNRFVVPYNILLLLIFNCHINVEIVSNIRAIKYLYKYFYKGHDAALITICNDNDKSENNTNKDTIDYDEIKDYIDSRYVGPVEAYWRITSKKLKDKSHAVMRLPVHLPNEQNIILNDNVDNSTNDSLQNALNQATMLIDYFDLNKRDETANQISYVNIPRHYVFKKVTVNGKKISQWHRRQRQFNVIGRMYSVSPSQTELFHLRLLLLYRKGATSYSDLQTVNGIYYDTFTATCLALGLIEDDDEWRKAMNEAAFWMMPNSLRKLFVNILLHCNPIHPDKLWEEFKIYLSEDYTSTLGLLPGQEKAYSKINEMLCKEGKCITDFSNMKSVNQNILENDNFESIETYMQIGKEQYELLNKQQRKIVDAVLKIVDNTNNTNRNNEVNKCFYLDGPAGTGKTFTYTTLWNLLKSRGKKIITMAFTGIAAILLPQGKTVHKTFKLSVPLFPDSSSNIKLQSPEGQILNETEIIIWDEAPMAPRYALEIIDNTLQDLMQNNLPFGGKIMVLGGDFRQLLPIQIGATRNEIINLSIKFSKVWKYFTTYTLFENMRVLPEEREFSQFLIKVGDGTLNDQNNDISIPSACILDSKVNLTEVIYKDLLSQKKFKEASKCAILAARNIDVNKLNGEVVNMLDEKTEMIYTSIDSTENCNENASINETLLPEYLNTLSPPSLPPYELRLRINTVVMLIRNLNINEGLCNGTRLIILEMKNHLLKCEILTGDKAGDIVFLNRITLYSENDYPFSFKRRQFPIKLAFAITINKSQGQTFGRIGIDLRKNVFNHGQLYVALSRVRSWSSLKIQLNLDERNEKDKYKVKNIVYKEMYSSL